MELVFLKFYSINYSVLKSCLNLLLILAKLSFSCFRISSGNSLKKVFKSARVMLFKSLQIKKSNTLASMGENHIIMKGKIDNVNGDEFSIPVPGKQYENPDNRSFSISNPKNMFKTFKRRNVIKFRMDINLKRLTFSIDIVLSLLLFSNLIAIVAYFQTSIRIQ